MCYSLDLPSFSVSVDGGFFEQGRWLIHGVIRYRSSFLAEARSDVEAEARTELMLAIVRESRSARAQGARSVYVAIEGDDELAGFFRMLDGRQAGRALGVDRA